MVVGGPTRRCCCAGGTDRVHECVTAREVGRPESLLRRMNELELDTTTSPARLILHGDAGRSECASGSCRVPKPLNKVSTNAPQTAHRRKDILRT